MTHAAIFDGEEYDARIPMGYDTPAKLGVPELNHEFAGDILPSEGAEVYLRYDLALAPQAAYVWSGVEQADDTHYGRVNILRRYSDGQTMTICAGETLVLDFGQNSAAVPAFVFEAREGTVLTFAPGELLNDKANPLYLQKPGVRNVKNNDQYVRPWDQDEPEEYDPTGGLVESQKSKGASEHSGNKIIRNGQMYIIRDGKVYSVEGSLVGSII